MWNNICYDLNNYYFKHILTKWLNRFNIILPSYDTQHSSAVI